jgi:hypothetical protein
VIWGGESSEVDHEPEELEELVDVLVTSLCVYARAFWARLHTPVLTSASHDVSRMQELSEIVNAGFTALVDELPQPSGETGDRRQASRTGDEEEAPDSGRALSTLNSPVACRLSPVACFSCANSANSLACVSSETPNLLIRRAGTGVACSGLTRQSSARVVDVRLCSRFFGIDRSSA